MIKAVIFDIDGTLADCTHRRHLVEQAQKDWPAFFNAMKDDKVVHIVRQLAWHLATMYDLLMVTGRPEEHRQTTNRWLQDVNAIPRALFMRRTGDFRPDTDVKREIYLERIAPIYDVQVVIDDRASVVKMWRALGLTCWQVAEGDF